jgi:ABC-2 type transport system ATP-binding protein
MQMDGILGAVEKSLEHSHAEPLSVGTRHWELQIQEHANPQLILQRCFESGIPLTRFDYTQPSLHDVFVHLVGSDAKEHQFR